MVSEAKRVYSASQMRIAQIALLPVKCEFIEGELVGEDRDSNSRMDDCILALSKISRSEILPYVQNAISQQECIFEVDLDINIDG